MFKTYTVRRSFFDAQAHQRLTFGTLVQKLRLPRDPGRMPLVSVFFNDKFSSPFDFGEVTVTGVEMPRAFYNFEFGLTAIDDGDGVVLECEFNADLFDDATVARWLAQYCRLLEQVVIDFMIPCESSKRSSAHPLRWSRLAASSTVYVGPDDCNGDTMLRPQHAATFAAFVADAQQRHARAGTSTARLVGR